VATIPSRIGNFEILRQIGSGGMGSVYLGRDPELDRQVAIKVIREEVHDQEVLDRFFREARAAAALRHPNIITVYASGQHDHKPYMAMEFIDGDSLADIIKQRRNVALSDKISYLEQICSGLHFAHKAGIVHRDIKPANVMVDREGVVRILDFGIARIEGSAMTQDGALMGSLNYMSPEQMLGRPVDLRSDIFSVGSLAYELLCYQQAFKGGLNDGLLQRLPSEDPPALTELYPGLPPALERVVMRALEKAPEKRFQNLAEMRSAIVEVQAGPQPEEGRTILIQRPGTPHPSTTAAPGVPPAGTAEAQRPATSFSGPAQVGEVVVRPETALPRTQGLQLKKEAAAAPRSASTVTKPASSTVTNRPTVVATPQPQTARRAPSRKWIFVGSAAGALVIAAAAAIPWLTAVPLNVLERERPGIEAAMGRFRTAYRNRNLEGVTEVFPTLPPETRQTMQRSFTNCLVYEVTFADMQVEMNPADATLAQVDVRSTHTCTPNSGGRQTTTVQRDVYTLRKSGDTWRIDSAVRAPNASADRTQ
jgi:serine/threonine-protein kinase